MAWFEINIKTSIMCIDAVSQLLYRTGANGVQILNPNDPDLLGNTSGLWDFFEPENTTLDFEGAVVTAYLERDSIEGTVDTLKNKLEELTSFGLDPSPGIIETQIVFQENWENEWKKYFKPIRLGKKMVVKPSWETVESETDEIVIEIDPGNAFGSGTHETTSLCIEMIEKYMRPSDHVLDVGCGSGILSIAAGLLGAKSILGVDIDPVAVKTARENIERNHLENISDIRQGDLLSVVDQPADLVVANIIAEIIIQLVDDIDSVIKSGGYFIASGIILQRLDSVLDKIQSSGLEVVETVKKGEWAVIVARKGL